MSFDPGSSAFRLRVGLTNVGDTVSGEFELYGKKNSGSYAAITTSSTSGVQSYDASSDADDTIIRVPRLYPFSGWWGAAVDLDFVNNKTFPEAAFTDFLSCSRASIGYAKTTTGVLTQFASNALRISDLGLLIEDARENLIWPSVPVGTSNWADWNTGHTDNSDTAPDGTTTALRLNDGTANNNHTFYLGSNRPTGSQNSTYTVSAWLKNVDRGYGYIQLTEGGSFHSIYAIINFSTGAISAATSSGANWTFVSSAAEAYGSDWWRVSITGTLAGSNAPMYPEIGLSNDGTTRSYTGSTKTILAWGAQVELATFASSYIQTTTTTATRAADVLTNTGDLQTDIASATGSIVAQIDNGKVASIAANIVDSNGTNLLGFDASNHGLASITATLATGNTANRTTQDKLGIAWDASGRSLVLNGGTVVTDGNIQTPSSTQHLGSSGAANFAYAYIERLTVWTSKLTDATLQGFTS